MTACPRNTRKVLTAALLFTLCYTALLRLALAQSPAGFRAHEWGTFTSVAGSNGRATEWIPYDGSSDLPGFVEHLGNQSLKGGLRGRMRMETPVLYLYSPQTLTVSVKVKFLPGLLTEWYPKASHVEPEPIPDHRFYDAHENGSIQWDSVTLEPGLTAVLEREKQYNQYYAARETSAAPLRIIAPGGEQHEKFLFYRGVSEAQPPLRAKVATDENVTVENLGGEEIPSVILFERRGDKVGYRPGGALMGETELNRPELNSTVDAVAGELESILVQQGLYNDEAQAMLKTWRKSWFEEGSRILYIVPRGFLETILPLQVSPAPSEIVRVFVGRLEVLTPTTEREITAAMAAQDNMKLRAYRRFLEPMANVMCAKGTAVGQLAQMCH